MRLLHLGIEVCTCDEPGRPRVASLSVSVVLCEFRGEVRLFQRRCLGEDVGKRLSLQASDLWR